MRTTTAYFAGVGTVAVALAAGLGGGLLFANIVAPHEPKYATEPNKLELRTAARAAPVTSTPSEPTSYLAATQPAATTPMVVAAPAQTELQKLAEPPGPPPPAEQQAKNAAAAPPETSTPSQAPAEPTAREPAASPREAFAKARDSDIKTRDGDIKRAATEKRRAERHPQWADKRRNRQPREQELEAVEQAVRNDTEPRQAFMAEPVKLDAPRIRLFGEE